MLTAKNQYVPFTPEITHLAPTLTSSASTISPLLRGSEMLLNLPLN